MYMVKIHECEQNTVVCKAKGMNETIVFIFFFRVYLVVSFLFFITYFKKDKNTSGTYHLNIAKSFRCKFY